MLPALAEHYKKNEDSLIVKTFGAFTVKTDSTDEVHLVLMENTLQLKNKEGLEYIFDLKGSLVDRKVKGKITPSTTLKDSNFLMAVKTSRNFIRLASDEVRRKLIAIVKSDVDFLAGLGFMDYSLLVGIETLRGDNTGLETDKVHQIGAPRTPTRDKKSTSDELLTMQFLEDVSAADGVMDVGERMSLKHCFHSGNRVYHISLIDFLQEWNFSKKGERFMKTVLLGKDGPTLSAIEPNQYA